MHYAQSSIRVAQAGDGTLTYLVDAAPEALPPVRSRDLAAVWEVAGDAARRAQWGMPRLLRFLQPDGSVTDMALSDADARCWAGAADHAAPLHTAYGLSLCLRLLALIDLLARAPWTAALCRIGRAGAMLDPALVSTAATVPLTSAAAFDEPTFRARLARLVPPLAGPPPPSGALA